MPRVFLNLMNPEHLELLGSQWVFAKGLVPGELNEGLVSKLESSPARLADYDDSGWEICNDLTRVISSGFTFAWYRLRITLPSAVEGNNVSGTSCVFETCIDDYGEIWIDGECDRIKGTVQGFNIPQRIRITRDAMPGETHTIAILAANGPLASPLGGVFVRYTTLAFEW